MESQKSTLQDSPYDDPERMKLEQAATMAQAAFRGYLARRAFRALKGIIRLQALIRGHLVRRQAISTLCCMMGIVKLQAHVRGVMARHSDVGLEVRKKFNQVNTLKNKVVVSLGVNLPARIGKLSANTFVRKLIASSPTVMPLLLHYDAEEPNSVWNWLERWSASCFWKPVPQPKKASDSKLRRKQANGQAVDMDTGRPKRSVRRIPPANLDGTSVQATSEFDKPKHNLRKVSSHPAEPMQENPQNVLEKVKRNLRKVHNPVVENSLQSEVEFEKPKQSLEKVAITSNLDIVEQSLNSLVESTNKETGLTVNSSAEKMEKDMATTVTSSAERMRKEMASVNSSAEKMKKESALTVNNSAEKMKKESALTINNSAEKMGQEMATVSSSTEKLKKETALTVNGSAEKMKKDSAVVVNGSAEKMRKEMTVSVSKSPEIETTGGPLGMNETSDLLHADPAVVGSKSLIDRTVKDENTPITIVELNRKDDSVNNENQKSGRKASTPAKQDRTENGHQSSPALPSYMAATESAKAKLRLQGSPRSGQDGGDKNNLSRRQSLPSSANGKISSESPRTQRPVHAGKAGSKSDRSMLSSRDANAKATQVEWRR
ncbi:hypothetical protein PTKIN_Ptkin04bG0073400 [Pterospermum kingtungense]